MVGRAFGFPLWGKLSPQVTDEGEICNCRIFPPHPARAAPPFPPRGRLLRRGVVTPPYGAIKNHCAVGAGYAPPAVLR